MPPQPDQVTGNLINDIEFTMKDVLNKLARFNPNKSAGPDGGSPRILKELANEISKPLYRIFRTSVDQGKLPKGWKVGYVSPIFKKADRHQAKNYCPGSMTSVIGKTLESLIRDKIITHLVERSLLTNCQHGFMKGGSWITHLLAVLGKWTEALDTGSNIGADNIWLMLVYCRDQLFY